uniref:Myelin basic protein n=1 Tax=Macrostomum lignano TaxID=282301 RepID=A0A1I8FSC9_9PLAT
TTRCSSGLLLLASQLPAGHRDQEQRRPPLTASRRSPYGRDGLDSLKERVSYGRSIRFKPRAN